ncbi:aspartate-semialdehyde dehydrogenase [Pseudomonas huanghezhanensis]|uniref:aspartate-semialdehyde dehydrogenase n=1 Tax=Pseudomonas huanghezhanensis TaxID=3002903 RepID=UPI0022859497|nr:aspartate-semialdehyde dehydrogenase [Pseudomonas sp. BSw22131]
MLPPLIPLSAAPVTSQLDPVKSTPEIPPVVAVQPGSSETTIDMRERAPEQGELLLREEQRRRDRRRGDRRAADRHPEVQQEPLAVPGDSLNADNTVPVIPIIDDEPRKGLWLDLKV